MEFPHRRTVDEQVARAEAEGWRYRGEPCECGCGEPAGVWSKNDRSRGQVKGESKRFKRGHSGGKPSAPVLVDPVSLCWIHTGAQNGIGYVSLWDRKRSRHSYAHRVFYEEYVGPIPEGLELDHLCRNRACCNPDHLEIVSSAENSRRASCTKLTAEDVAAIRAAYAEIRVGGRRRAPDGFPQRLAAQYGVSVGTVIEIARGKTTWT